MLSLILSKIIIVFWEHDEVKDKMLLYSDLMHIPLYKIKCFALL